MSRSRVVFAVVCLVPAAAASPAQAQVQRWQHPWGAVESRVTSCAVPTPLNKIAADDFQYPQTTIIRWIRWWGVVLDPAQLAAGRYYYIAIYSNGNPCAGPCGPVNLLASWCVNPTKTVAGTDCRVPPRTVYRFTASLAPSFIALGGTKYWVQISEADDVSARPGVEDFRWSGYRPPVNCPAEQSPPLACAIADDCVPAVATDLSFELRSTCLAVVVAVPAVVLPPAVFLADIRPVGAPSGSPPLVRECMDLDSDGTAILDPGPLPDGDYTMTLIGMGMPHFKRQFAMANGVGSCSFFDIFTGDLNNSGMADGDDIQPLVDGVLHP